MKVNFDRDSLLQSAIKLSSAMIFATDKPRGDTPIITAIKRWREEERFGTPEEAENVLRELLAKMVDQRMQSFEEFLASWREYNKTLRVCCFSSRPDNTSAWDHFADRHQGVCLRFSCEEGSAANKPVAIEYKNSRPAITTLKEQIDAILYNLPTSGPDFESLFTIKSPARKLEQEWRCFRKATQTTIAEDSTSWFEDIPYESAEMSAVCFGIETSEEDKKAIEKIMKENFPVTRCFQANLANGKYELEIQKAGSAA